MYQIWSLPLISSNGLILILFSKHVHGLSDSLQYNPHNTRMSVNQSSVLCQDIVFNIKGVHSDYFNPVFIPALFISCFHHSIISFISEDSYFSSSTAIEQSTSRTHQALRQQSQYHTNTQDVRQQSSGCVQSVQPEFYTSDGGWGHSYSGRHF